MSEGTFNNDTNSQVCLKCSDLLYPSLEFDHKENLVWKTNPPVAGQIHITGSWSNLGPSAMQIVQGPEHQKIQLEALEQQIQR